MNSSISAINDETIIETGTAEVFCLFTALNTSNHKTFLRELGALRQINVVNECESLNYAYFHLGVKSSFIGSSVANV